MPSPLPLSIFCLGPFTLDANPDWTFFLPWYIPQELELLLCGIPEIDVSEWKRCSRYLGDYRRAGENHVVIKVPTY